MKFHYGPKTAQTAHQTKRNRNANTLFKKIKKEIALDYTLKHKIYLFASLVLLHVLDGVFSYMFIQDTLHNEANGFIKLLYIHFEALGIFGFKMLALALLLNLITVLPRFVFAFLNIIMIPVIIMGGIMAFQL